MGKLIASVIKNKEGRIIERILVVLPIEKEEPITEEGMLIPEGAGKTMEIGVVYAVSEGSEFKEGDSIAYPPINRKNQNPDRILNYEGHNYDLVCENDVWGKNDQPHGFVFVKHISQMEVSETELIIPDGALGVPQTGIVVEAPGNSFLKNGDTVMYRKLEGRIYSKAIYQGIEVDVLTESSIFMVNHQISPGRILLKIDKVEQDKNRSIIDYNPFDEDEIKAYRNQKNIAMKHNLQYAEVISIGDGVDRAYPDLFVNDFAIIHHTIEDKSNKWRIIKVDKDDRGNILYEYRILEANDISDRMIFGKMVPIKSAIKGLFAIVPFGKYIFMEYKITMFDKNVTCDSDFINYSFEIPKTTDIHELKMHIIKKVKDASEKYSHESERLRNRIVKLNSDIREELDEGHAIETKLMNSGIEFIKNKDRLQGNIIVKCKQLYPKREQPYILVNKHKQIYPLNIPSGNYLVITSDLIIGDYNSNLQTEQTMYLNKFTANLDKLLVRPINEVSVVTDTQMNVPDFAKTPPQKGLVLSAGPKVSEAKEGDIVYWRVGAGDLTPVEGEELLIIRDEDLNMVEVQQN